MKTKLEMAHEYAMQHLKNSDGKITMHSLCLFAWQYADAMQAEADKRKPNPVLPALHQTFIDGVEQPRYAEECQPDWSQAPEWANFIVMSKAGASYWHANEPKTSGNGWVGGGLCDLAYMDFYHTGDWRDSLRKRP